MQSDLISARRRFGVVSSALSLLLLLGADRFSPPLAEGVNNRPHPDSAVAAAAVARFRSALAAGDTAAVLSLLAPDVVILESGGIETLRDYRSHHLADDIAFAKAVTGVRSPLRAVISGSVAWVSSTSTVKGMFKGRPIDSAGAELMVLTRTGTEWKIRAIHWSSHSRLTGG